MWEGRTPRRKRMQERRVSVVVGVVSYNNVYKPGLS